MMTARKPRPSAQMDHASSGWARKKAREGEVKMEAERAAQPSLTPAQVLRQAALGMATQRDDGRLEFWQLLADLLNQEAEVADYVTGPRMDGTQGTYLNHRMLAIAVSYLNGGDR